jgi:hypothetical protein
MKKLLNLLFLVFVTISLSAQQFEAPQDSGTNFQKLKVHVGADFAIQYQMLEHHADSALIPLGKGFNLPTANLNLNADLAPGIHLNLVTYLASRHHNDTWVKGGYIVFDKLPFLKSDFIDKVMDYLTITLGDMELNYGDAHFRRSDNGHVVTNPFVGNLIMDAFTTAPASEIMFRDKGILAMVAITSGTLNQTLTSFNAKDSTYTTYNAAQELAFYWKAGYDEQFTEDIRVRLTLSGYHNQKNHSGSLYGGDRTGSRYYLVMKNQTDQASDVDITSNHLTGNFNPGTLKKNNSYMLNLFTQIYGLEVFGTFEAVSGVNSSNLNTKFSQYAAEGIYRFGKEKQFYGGLRYNIVNDLDNHQSVDRLQVGAGWFLIPSVLFKAEYVNQKYNDFIKQYGSDAGFKGFMIEAAISF